MKCFKKSLFILKQRSNLLFISQNIQVLLPVSGVFVMFLLKLMNVSHPLFHHNLAVNISHQLKNPNPAHTTTNRLVASNAFLRVLFGGRPAPGPGAAGAAEVHSRRTPGRRLPLFIPPWCRSINIAHTHIHTHIKVFVWFGSSVRLVVSHQFRIKNGMTGLGGVRFLVFLKGAAVVKELVA